MKRAGEQKSYRLCQISWCLIALIALFFLSLNLMGIHPEGLIRLFPPCVFRHYLGLYCPGCGGTRAAWELLHGHILSALWYHPIVPYTVVLFGWYLISNTVEWITCGRYSIGSSYRRWYGTAAVIIVAVNWILRNVLLLCFHIPLL